MGRRPSKTAKPGLLFLYQAPYGATVELPSGDSVIVGLPDGLFIWCKNVKTGKGHYESIFVEVKLK